jgi:hypothetical protein
MIHGILLCIPSNTIVASSILIEIVIANIPGEPFFNSILIELYNLIVHIHSYELSGNEFCSTIALLQNRLGTVEDYNSLFEVGCDTILNDYFKNMENLTGIIQALGEGLLI